MKETNWLEYIRDGADYRICSECADGFFGALSKYFDARLKKLLLYFKDYILYWNYDEKDLNQLGEIIVKKLLNKNFRKKIINLFKQKTDKILVAAIGEWS